MKLYSVRVRLNGSSLNEVHRINCTAAELQLLAAIHGGGDNYPLAEVKYTGDVNRTDARERQRLHNEYHEWNQGKGPALIARVLGATGAPLPQSFAPPELAPERDEGDEEEIIRAGEEPPEEIDTLARAQVVLKDAPIRTRVHQKQARE